MTYIPCWLYKKAGNMSATVVTVAITLIEYPRGYRSFRVDYKLVLKRFSMFTILIAGTVFQTTLTVIVKNFT